MANSNFIPPSWHKPEDYSYIPKSIDDLFNAYYRAKNQSMQNARFAQEKRLSDLQIANAERDKATGELGSLVSQGGYSAADLTAPEVVQGARAAMNFVGPVAPGAQMDDRVRVLTSLFTAHKTSRDNAARMGQLGIQKAEGEVAKLGEEKKKLAAEAEKEQAIARGGGLDPAKRAELSNKLRDDLTKASGAFVNTRNALSKMESAAKDATGASDWALVYLFNKLLDDASAVRDPEVQNTINTGSAYQRLDAFKEQLKSGAKLGAEGAKLRQDIVNEGRKLFKAIEPYQTRTVKQYREIAKRQGLDDRDVVIDSDFIPAPESGGGTEEVALKDAKGNVRKAIYQGNKFVRWAE